MRASAFCSLRNFVSITAIAAAAIVSFTRHHRPSSTASVVAKECGGDEDKLLCPFVMPVHPKTQILPEGGTSGKGGIPPFVIYNHGKSGSHFLTQTLTNLGLPVAFEYGLRRNTSTAEKTKNALQMYGGGKVNGFSGAQFRWGEAQDAVDGGPTNWTDILQSLSELSTPGTLRHVVLLRTNLIAKLIGSPAGRTAKMPEAHFSAEDLKKVNRRALNFTEEINLALIKDACRSGKRLSPSGTAHIFVINYESLLIDPAKWFNRLVSFLGKSELAETEIVKAVEGGVRKRTHTTMIYSDVGLKGVTDNLFIDDQFNASTAAKDCYLHQALASFPREEYMCFHGCIVPSGMYLCP
ncbi:hypothetical protein ACHAWF_001807 [Thalassiosira exigua]